MKLGVVGVLALRAVAEHFQSFLLHSEMTDHQAFSNGLSCFS